METANTPEQAAAPPRRIGIGGGLSLALEAAGAGPPLLLLHGIGGHRGQWRAQLAGVCGAARIAFDARGYGDSDGPGAPAFATFADDLLRLMDRLGIERALAAGHSMGGRVLIEAALRAPERFAALFLSGTQPAYLAHMTPEGRADYVARRRALFSGGTVTPEGAARVAEQVLPPGAPAALRAAMAADLAGLRAEGFLAALAASAGWDRRADLARLALPVTVVGGSLDPVCPPAETEALAAALGQGPAVLLDGVAHMVQLEAPGRIAALLQAFVDRHGPGLLPFDTATLNGETIA